MNFYSSIKKTSFMLICSFLMATTAGVMSASAAENKQVASQPSSMTATYGNWLLRCRDGLKPVQAEGESAAEAKKVCEMAHVIRIATKDQKGNTSEPQVLAKVAFGKLPNSDKYKIIYQVPGNVWLRDPVFLRLADKQEALESAEGQNLLSASYFRCTANSCLADIDLSKEQVEALTNAKFAQIAFVDGARTPLNVPLSLDGFGAALIALDKQNAS